MPRQSMAGDFFQESAAESSLRQSPEKNQQVVEKGGNYESKSKKERKPS